MLKQKPSQVPDIIALTEYLLIKRGIRVTVVGLFYKSLQLRLPVCFEICVQLKVLTREVGVALEKASPGPP